jgi:multicomponent Na+:H+ antiporter subunit E
VNAPTAFLVNLLFALVWAAATGIFTLGNLIVGFALSFAVLLYAQRVVGASSYFDKFRQAVALAVFFVWELVMASIRVAYDVITPVHLARPGVLAIPLDAKTDEEITMLASMISLTPGTLSLEVSEDRRLLYIHAMFIDDADELRREVKQGFERRLLELLR